MRLNPVRLDNIVIEDAFWSKHTDLVRQAILPYQWNAMHDLNPGAEPSHCIENFRIAAGFSQGEFHGFVFQDTDLAKWLEAVGYTLAVHPDAELERRADEMIDLVAAAQGTDGYLNTYFTIKAPEQRWKNITEGHELYTAGHFMEAAIAYYEGTGKRKLLDVMIRFSDLICDTFGPEDGKIHAYPGHQEVEIGLIKMFDATGNKRYLDMAKYFIDARGVGENYFVAERKRVDFDPIFNALNDSGYDPSYSQSHAPVREQREAVGHAVRAVYMYCAMADLADRCGDDSLFEACKTLWDNMVNRRMYITGGIGSSGILERFTADYDLPNASAYSESCAAIGLALFGLRMNRITRDASYIDVAERSLYNTVLSGIALDGKSFFYVNPLEVWPDNCLPKTSMEHVKHERQKWFGCACCPPNIARTLASLGQYIYSVLDDCMYVNMFVSGSAKTDISGQQVQLTVNTRFPLNGDVELAVTGVPSGGMKLAVRIPDYAENFMISLADGKLDYVTEKGYAVITLDSDVKLTVSMSVKARFVRANPIIREDCGKVAVMRGPVVYCLEQQDNGENLQSLFIDLKQPLSELDSDLFGGTVLVEAGGKRLTPWPDGAAYSGRAAEYTDAKLRFVPYAYWCNREHGEMSVWVKEYHG